jgi:S1-C subfamily serine protease
VTLTPKLGRYFGTDKGVLVVRGPRNAEFKLEEGDVIVDIDGRVPQNGAHALRILRSYQPGEKVTLNVLRDRKPVKLAVTMPKGMDGDGEGGAFFFNEPVPFTRKLPDPDDGPT